MRNDAESGTGGVESTASGQEAVKAVVDLKSNELEEVVKKESVEAVKKRLQQAKEKLEKTARKIKQDLGEKLAVGGKHKEELDKFIESIEGEARKIQGRNISDGEKFSDLEELKEKKKEELRKKIENWRKAEEKIDDNELKKRAGGEEDKKIRERAERVVNRIIELKKEIKDLDALKNNVEKAKREIESDSNQRTEQELKTAVVSFTEKYNEIAGGMRGIAKETQEMAREIEKLGGRATDYSGLEYSLEEKINRTIRERQAKLSGAKKAIDLKDKVKLFKVRAFGSQADIELTDRELDQILLEIGQAEGKGEISESLAKKMEADITKAMKRVGVLRKAREKVQKGEEKEDIEIGKEERKKMKERLKEYGLPAADQERLMKLSGGDYEELNKIIGAGDDVVKNTDATSRGMEGDPEDIDHRIEVMRAIVNGNFLENYTSWRKTVESQFRPERMLDDAKREIIATAVHRLETKGGERAIIEEDVEAWVLEKFSRVIAGGEESTGYSARQFLAEISGILEAKDLDFEGLLKRDNQQIEGSRLEKDFINEYTEGIKKSFGDDDGEHVIRASNDFREQMTAVIVINELRNAYDRSVSPEDMMRISGVAKTDQMAWAMDLESTKKEVSGRLAFYEVEVDAETGLRKTLSLKDFNDEKLTNSVIDQLHTAEINKGGVKMVIEAKGKRFEIKPSDFDKLLQIEDQELSVQTGDVMDILNQGRFANGVLSSRSQVSDKMKKEVVREVMMVGLGLVDIDGEINTERIEKLVKIRYDDKNASLKLYSAATGENLTGKKRQVRLRMIMEKVGDNPRIKHAVSGEKVLKLREGKDDEISMVIGGVREAGHSLDDMENEYKMVFKLAEGMWNFTGLSIAHWDKQHLGDNKDWHRKILHFVKYAHMFGIGPGHLREHVGIDYHDFVTRRLSEIVPELFDKSIILKCKNGKEVKGTDAFERKELVRLLVKDRDGFFLSRQRMLDMFGRYREWENEKKGKGKKWLRNILEEKAQYRFGKHKGTRLVNKHWDDMAEFDWTKSLKRDGRLIEMEGVPKEKVKEETRGFRGIYWFAKKQYNYANLSWGRGKRPTDNIWSQRLYKEAQYIFSGDKTRAAWIPWLAGNPESINGLIQVIKMSGWYDQADLNRKGQLMLGKWHEYFTNRWVPIKTAKMDMHHNNTLEDEDKPVDDWDGTLNYEKETIALGACLARKRGLRPYTAGQFAEVVNQMQRAGVFTPLYANEIRRQVSELGGYTEAIDTQVDKIKPGIVRAPLKLLKSLILGSNVNKEKLGALGALWFWDEKRFPGVFGILWKLIDIIWSDFRRSLGDILRGMVKKTEEQIGEAFKEGTQA